MTMTSGARSDVPTPEGKGEDAVTTLRSPFPSRTCWISRCNEGGSTAIKTQRRSLAPALVRSLTCPVVAMNGTIERVSLHVDWVFPLAARGEKA